MRAHVITHVPFEGPAAILDALAVHGIYPDGTRMHLGEKLPDVRDVDFLVVMGGPMSVLDSALYPWLADELLFISEFLSKPAPRALGRSRRNGEPESRTRNRLVPGR